MALRTLLHGALPEVSDTLGESLDQTLGDIDADEQWLHISKLAVDIRLKPEQMLDRQAIIQAIQSQFQTECQQIAPLIQRSPRQISKQKESSDSYQPPITQTDELDITALSPLQLAQQELLEYIRSGTLPWYVPSDLDMTENWQRLLEQDFQLDILLKQITSFEALVRLFSLAGTTDGQIWIKQLIPESGQSIATMIPELSLLAKKQEILSYQQGLLVLAAVWASVKSTSPSASSIAKPSNPLPVISNTQLNQIYQQLQLKKSMQVELRRILTDWRLLDSDTQSKPAENLAEEFSEHTDSQIYRIDFAGLILLHPYLPRLFKRLDWLSDDQQIKPDKIEAAAQALSYLATGEFHLPEYQLSGIKLLLNLHPEALLITGKSPLESTIVDELDAVLKSLLSHWSALKNSSPQGLQQAFLQRQGLLQQQRQQQDHWQLTIERQGMDILIDQLPFAITTV